MSPMLGSVIFAIWSPGMSVLSASAAVEASMMNVMMSGCITNTLSDSSFWNLTRKASASRLRQLNDSANSDMKLSATNAL
eukprot:364056-Chlamydomonas_euryale.AAC.3